MSDNDVDFCATGLYELSRILGERNPDAQAHGFFGGEWGYGQDFENDTFEMHPFWWGDCECGYEDREWTFDETNPTRDQRLRWLAENAHDPKCGVARPNFRHKATGVEVRWYKYIGRSMEADDPLDFTTWHTILGDCLASLNCQMVAGEAT